MPIGPLANRMLQEEARALMTRLDRIKPFALLEAMVPAAGLFPNAQTAIERTMLEGRRELRRLIRGFLSWLERSKSGATAEQAQRRLSILRLRFHAVLNEFDMFSDVITQRSEQDNGTWLSGLDIVAADDRPALPPARSDEVQQADTRRPVSRTINLRDPDRPPNQLNKSNVRVTFLTPRHSP